MVAHFIAFRLTLKQAEQLEEYLKMMKWNADLQKVVVDKVVQHIQRQMSDLPL